MLPAALHDGVSRLAGQIVWRAHHSLLDRFFDRARGAETSGAVPPDELGATGANARHAVEYSPTPSLVFRRAVGSLGIDPARFVFVDLGSGKGRTLLMAARLPFKRLEGVEFSGRLHAIASANLACLEQPERIRLHHCDAAAYAFPPEPSVLFLYNPFGRPVLARVLERLERSLERTPREVHLLYVNPVQADLLDRCAALRRVERRPVARLVDAVLCPTPFRFLHYRSRAEPRDVRPGTEALTQAG
jgi:SAM-dependent methyltransferase